MNKEQDYLSIFKKVKNPPSKWSIDEMCEHLLKFRIIYYRRNFKKNKIDGKTFLKMKKPEFKKIATNEYDSDIEEISNCQKILKDVEKMINGEKLDETIPKEKQQPANDSGKKKQFTGYVESGSEEEEQIINKKPIIGKKNIVMVESGSEEEEKIPIFKNEKKIVQLADSGPIEEELSSTQKPIIAQKKIVIIESGSEQEEQIINNNKKNYQLAESGPIEEEPKKPVIGQKKVNIHFVESGSEEEEHIKTIKNEKKIVQLADSGPIEEELVSTNKPVIAQKKIVLVESESEKEEPIINKDIKIGQLADSGPIEEELI